VFGQKLFRPKYPSEIFCIRAISFGDRAFGEIGRSLTVYRTSIWSLHKRGELLLFRNSEPLEVDKESSPTLGNIIVLWPNP
jgi:hypothetical protein